METPRLHGRQARWCMALSPFDFVIRHRAGKKNPADGPSRMMKAGSRDALDATLLNPLAARMDTETVPEQASAKVSLTLADLYELKTELVSPSEGQKPLDRSRDTCRQELGRSQ